MDELCHGEDLSRVDRPNKIELQWLIRAYSNFPDKENFFKKGFFRIAGTQKLQEQLTAGQNEKQIRKTWEKDLEDFRAIRQKYLLYP